MVHEQMSRFFQGFRRDAHPMAIMTGCVGALSAFYHDSTDISDPHQRMVASIRMIAKMPTLAAMAYKYSIGQPFIYPKNDLDYATNFLRMCFAVPCEEYKPNQVLARAMDRIFILHADHEQNASTSTVRLAGSSGANPFACIAAGIACLWGPAHGGANEAALKMLAEIGSVDRIPEYIKRSKDKNDSFRLMGFGHRVYKHYDPRAKIMQKTAHEVLNELGIKDDPLLDVAMELERIALSDEYFIEKKLYPNVDFYSGITLKAIDTLPVENADVVYWDAVCPGFGVKVTPKGRKVFIVMYRTGGAGSRVRKFTIGPFGRVTLHQARIAAQKVFAAKLEGRDPAAEKGAAKRRIVADRVEDVLDTFIAQHLSQNRSGSEVSRLLRREVGQPWNGRSIHEITKRNV